MIQSLEALLTPFGLQIERVDAGSPIPGSYWGEPEAGLIGCTLYLSCETPVHSALHEAGHFICMSDERRSSLHTHAGGDDLEECAVCYLQLIMADELPGVGREHLARDMDDWGYSFRLGSTLEWFTRDAEDAQAWLIARGLLTVDGHVIPPRAATAV